MNNKTKWILIVLGLSLVLNIFAIGIFIGQGAKMVFPQRHMAPPIDFNLKRLERSLSPEERVKVRTLLREKRHDIQQRYKALMVTEQKIKEIILSPVVDKNLLDRVLIEHGQKTQSIHEPMRRIVLETIADLDLEARQKIMQNLFRGFGDRRMGPRHHMRNHPAQETHKGCPECDEKDS